MRSLVCFQLIVGAQMSVECMHVFVRMTKSKPRNRDVAEVSR